MNQRLPPLSSMIGDLSLQAFLSHHWDRRPLHVRGAVERPQALMDREVLLSRIRSDKKASVTAYFPDPNHTVTQRAGIRPVVQIAPDQVDAALAAGAGIAVRNLHELDERIGTWTLALRRALGFVGRVSCTALLGFSIAPHFDASSVISLQLAGCKTWRISRAPALVHPADAALSLPDGAVTWRDGSKLIAPRNEWELGAEPFDEAKAADYALAPGDTLFVPAGCWHRTAGDAQTLSLSVNFERVELCEWVAQAFEHVLGANPAWRHLPPQPDADGGEIPPSLRAFFAERLAELSRALAAPDAVDRVLHRAFKRSLAEPGASIVRAPATTGPRNAAPPGPDDILAVRNPLQWTFMDTRDAQGRPIVEIFTGQREILFDEPDMVPFGREIGRRTRFVAGEATRWAGEGRSYRWEQVQQMLATLVDEGAIVIEDGGLAREARRHP